MAKEKKKFKDTLFGKILNKGKDLIGDLPGIVAKAGGNPMGIVTSVISELAGKKDDPKAKALLAEITLQLKEIELEFEKIDLEEFKVQEQNITSRWRLDSKSESWLAKNIRPLVVANFTLLIDAVIISSMAGKDLGEAFLPILMTMGITAIGGYFTLREYGKTKK